MTADRLPLEFCPLCSRADATTKQASAVADDTEMAAAVTLPERVCGRCAVKIARAALGGGETQYATMKGLKA